jgi:hypothetical protein
MISYVHMDHLTVLSPEAVALHIKGIAACLGPSTVELTLPLNAAKCPQLPFAIVAGNQVVLQDGNGPHQALVQVVVDFIRVEVWMVKNPLYQMLHLTSVVTVYSEVFLQNAFAL